VAIVDRTAVFVGHESTARTPDGPHAAPLRERAIAFALGHRLPAVDVPVAPARRLLPTGLIPILERHTGMRARDLKRPANVGHQRPR